MGRGALIFAFACASTFPRPSRSSSEHSPPQSLYGLLRLYRSRVGSALSGSSSSVSDDTPGTCGASMARIRSTSPAIMRRASVWTEALSCVAPLPVTLIFSVNPLSCRECRRHPRSGVLPPRSLPPYRSTWPRPPRPRRSPSVRLSPPPQRPRPSAASPWPCRGGRSRVDARPQGTASGEDATESAIPILDLQPPRSQYRLTSEVTPLLP